MNSNILNVLRQMTDEQLTEYLKSLSGRASGNCVKCGRTNANYTVNIQNKKKTQQKKLCNLCESCYTDLLEYLGTCNIIWD
jgi:hypothetical protein